LADDIARIRAVLAQIGPDAAFMIDANYSLTRAQAIELSRVA
jgi:L-alanine-DL-glutamate epimerase-like enolase superfamily enzyme